MPATLSTPVWGDPAGEENPGPLRGSVSADVCVVGLGGSGLAAVGRLLEAGASVAGVDAGPVAGGAAGRNGGFLLAGAARRRRRYASRGMSTAPSVRRWSVAHWTSSRRSPPASRSRSTRPATAAFEASVRTWNFDSAANRPPTSTP